MKFSMELARHICLNISDVHHHFTRDSTENFIVPSVSGVAATTLSAVELKIGTLYPRMSNKSALSMVSNLLQDLNLRSKLQLMESDTYVYY